MTPHPRRALAVLALGLALVGCQERSRAQPAPTAADTRDLPPAEPALAKRCTTDAECSEAAPRCLPFDEDEFVAVNPRDALAMHCSRACDANARCPAGYACRRLPSITGVENGRIVGSVTSWCGEVVEVTPAPFDEIPRWVVARYYAEGMAGVPLLSLHWDKGEVVVKGPGLSQSFADPKAAREAVEDKAAEVRAWTELWPANVPLGPGAPDGLDPRYRRTLYKLAETLALPRMSSAERVAREGAVLTWPLRGGSLPRLHTEGSREFVQESAALDAFFARAPGKTPSKK